MGSSVPFDRAAEYYDETRGGLTRGRAYAEVLHSLLDPDSRVLDIGVGTALVAGPLAELGHSVVGVDLSRPMLARGRSRLAALIEGDAAILPIASSSVDAVVAVWAIHVVGLDKLDALVAELLRVLRPGGTLLHVSPTPEVNANDVNDLAFRLGADLGRHWDRSATLAPRLAAHGLVHEGEREIPDPPFETTPSEQADRLERREFSSVWDLDAATWDAVVQPIIDGLRALPDPDRPRTCRYTHLLSRYRV